MEDPTASFPVDTLDLLERALAQTRGLVAAVEPSQASLATPCSEWDVRHLVRHVVMQDLRNFTAAARGEAADWQGPMEELDDDWTAAFDERARELLEIWRTSDLDAEMPMPGGRAA